MLAVKIVQQYLGLVQGVYDRLVAQIRVDRGHGDVVSERSEAGQHPLRSCLSVHRDATAFGWNKVT